MIHGQSIALAAFTVFNAVGVLFLLYVLVRFWKEEHKPKVASQPASGDFTYDGKPGVVIVAAPVVTGLRRESGQLIRFPILESNGQVGDRSQLPGQTKETRQSAAR